jgi:hypothetical protein
MTAIETNMALLREDCRKANRFMDANNTTDCCGDIRLDIDENAGYTQIKIDAVGNQIRIASMTISQYI